MLRFIVAAALALPVAAQAQQTIKIGVLLTLSGQFADAAAQMDNGIKTYMKQHGDTVAGKKIEIIRKDVGGPAPDVAKRLAQELVVRDKVDMLAGFTLTPNALAVADVSAEAKKFMVVMHAATSIVITKSRYMIRTSVTLPQVMETFGTWAATKGGIKQSYTMVTDYGPGHDSETALQSPFQAAGGALCGAVRFPAAEPDRRQDRRRDHDRGGQGPEVGKPARPDDDRSRDPRRGAERVHPPRAEGRQRAGQRAFRYHPDGEGPRRRA